MNPGRARSPRIAYATSWRTDSAQADTMLVPSRGAPIMRQLRRQKTARLRRVLFRPDHETAARLPRNGDREFKRIRSAVECEYMRLRNNNGTEAATRRGRHLQCDAQRRAHVTLAEWNRI